MRMRLLLGTILLLLPFVGYAQVGNSPKSGKGQTGPELGPTPTKSPDALTGGDLLKLKRERETLASDREGVAKEISADADPMTTERTKLRLQLAEILKKINERKSTIVPPPAPSHPKTPVEDSKSLDPLN